MKKNSSSVDQIREYILQMGWIFILFLFLLISCRSGEQSPKKKATTTIAINLKTNPDKFNPYMTTSAYSSMINNQIFSPLLTLDPDRLVYVPYLAEGLPEREEIIEGKYQGMVAYNYRIRDKAQWDNGSEITGYDYAFTIKMVQLKGVDAPIYRSYLGFIEDVIVDEKDPKSFSVVTTGDYFKANEMTGLTVLPAYHYDATNLLANYTLQDIKNESFYQDSMLSDPDIPQLERLLNSRAMTIDTDGINGSGAYRLAQFQPDQSVLLTKKDNWWGDELSKEEEVFSAFPDRLRYEITNDMNTAYNKLLESYVDILNETDPGIFEEARKDQGDKLQFFTPASAKYYYFGFNTLQPPLNSLAVRKALSHLVDYETIITLLCNGHADRIIGPILPDKSYYNRSIVPTVYNPDIALKILKEEGWTDHDNNGILDKTIAGKLEELRIPVLVSSGSIILKEAVKIWAQNAKDIGVSLDIQAVEFGILRKKLKTKEFSCFALAAALDLGLDDLYQQWHTQSILTGSNRSGFGNEISDALIEKIRSNISEEERKEAYLEIQNLIHDSYPFIFLFTPKERIIMSSNIKNPKVSAKHPGFFENYYRVVTDHEG